MKSKYKKIFAALLIVILLGVLQGEYLEFLRLGPAILLESVTSLWLFVIISTPIFKSLGNNNLSVVVAIFFIFFNAGLTFKKPFYNNANPMNKFINAYLREAVVLAMIILIFHFNRMAKYQDFRFYWQELLIFIVPFPFYLYGRHLLLRGILWIDNLLPLNLLTFLREMDARHIFESPGGTWRFRHKILQDYFIQEYEQMEREQVG